MLKFFSSKTVTFLLLLACNMLMQAGNKIIYFISPPRSLSVAFLRMMDARGDFTIMHEPSQWAFNKNAKHDFARDWFIPEAAETFDEVKKRIFKKAETSNVFVKEISFAVHDFLLHDQELMKNPNVHFVFMVRCPHDTIISFYNRRNGVVEDFNIPFAKLVGYQACWEIYQAVATHGHNQPYILLSEDLYSDPHTTVKRFCEHLDIPFKPEALQWENLGDNFSGQEEWSEIKYQETTQHWHGNAIKSTQFGKPTTYEVDASGKPTFEEVSNPKHREICKAVYLENMKFYELLLARI